MNMLRHPAAQRAQLGVVLAGASLDLLEFDLARQRTGWTLEVRRQATVMGDPSVRLGYVAVGAHTYQALLAVLNNAKVFVSPVGARKRALSAIELVADVAREIAGMSAKPEEELADAEKAINDALEGL
jgi:hypothetical protein